MNKCKKCGGIHFGTIGNIAVDMILENGVLKPENEENLGYNGVFTCYGCDTEYENKDFKRIE